MSKLCIVYNFAQLYRGPIFRLIDKEWECEWYFGKNTTDIKGMNTAVLHNVTFVDNKKIFGQLETQSGIGGLIRKKDVTTMLMLGEPMVWSTWWNLIQRRLFYPRKRIYLWTHGWYGREGFTKKWLKRIFFGLADKVFLYGNYAKKIAVSQGFPEKKLVVIHNSLDHSEQLKLRQHLKPTDIYRSHFGNDYPVLIFIGRLTTVKRLDMIIDAVKILKEKGSDYNVVFVGDGEKRYELEKNVNDNKLQNQFWFYGACYDDHKNAQLIYDADLCVAPGNVGLTAMHTMVFGTPVLTHNNLPMQMPEFEAIQTNKTGAFFNYNDSNSLANEIDNWFKSTAGKREKIRQACYDEIDNYWTPEYQINVIKNNIDGAIN